MIIDSPIISGSLSATGSLNQVGNVTISGSLNVTGDISGNVTGTATNATSASYAATSSFNLNSVNLTGNQSVAGEKSFSNVITVYDSSGIRFTDNPITTTYGSIIGNPYYWQFTAGADTILFNTKNSCNGLMIDANGNSTMRNVTANFTGSLLGTAANATSASYSTSGSYSRSGSYAVSSSYSYNADVVSSSYAAASASLSTRVTTAESTLSTVSSSYAAASASLSTRVTSAESTLNTVSSSYAAASASLSTRTTALETASGSYSTRVTNLEATSSTVSSSYAATSASISNRVKLIEDQYATTGSNTFTGTQNITNTTNPTGFTTTAAVYTAGGLQVSKDTYVSGSLYVKGNVTVYGTQSVSYITSSQLSISTNIINVNTALPSVRFGGIAVYDSGSSGLTGSLFWDSQNNTWIYDNPSGSGNYDSAMVIMGPRNATGLGNEVGLSCNYLVQGHGHHHTTSSVIFHDGTNTCIPNTLIGGTVCTTMANASCVGVGTTTPSTTLDVNGTGRFSGLTQIGTGTYYSGAPTYAQLVVGSCTTSDAGIVIQSTNTTISRLLLLNASNNGSLIRQDHTTDNFEIWNGGSKRFNITSTGIACFACQVCTPVGMFTYTAGQPAVNVRASDSNFALMSIFGNQAGDVNWLLMSGYPAAGDFTIRQSDTVNALTIKKTTGIACFASTVCAAGHISSEDIRIYRSAGTTTGYINFGSTGTNYFGFDGSNYVTNGALAATNGLFSGCIGIGTASPTSKLYVATPSSGTGVTFRTTGGTYNPGIFFTTDEATSKGSIIVSGTTGALDMALGAGGAEVVTITGGGKVGIGITNPTYTLSVGGRGYFFATNQDAGWGNLTLDYGNGDNSNIYAIQMKEGGAVNAAIGYGSYSASSCGDVIMWANNGGGLVERMRIYANSGTKFYVEESASNTNGFGVVGRTCSKAVYIGANCTYGSIQSHGSVPLRINELGNDIILAAASNNVGVGTTTPSAKLEVAGVICASGAICSNGTIWVGTNLRVGSGASVGNSTDPAITAGGCSKAGIYFDNGSVGLGACGQAAYMNSNGTLQVTSTTMFGSNGLWQQSVGGIRFNAQSLGGGVVHIKTNIYHQNSVMIAANVRGYEYSPDAIDTDIYFYTYTGASYVYGFGVYKKTATGWTYGAYYSTDDYVVLYVSGLGNYAGFTLNFNNTSLLQNSEVKVLAWKAASTTSAQY